MFLKHLEGQINCPVFSGLISHRCHLSLTTSLVGRVLHIDQTTLRSAMREDLQPLADLEICNIVLIESSAQ